MTFPNTRRSLRARYASRSSSGKAVGHWRTRKRGNANAKRYFEVCGMAIRLSVTSNRHGMRKGRLQSPIEEFLSSTGKKRTNKPDAANPAMTLRSEEHTSELQ